MRAEDGSIPGGTQLLLEAFDLEGVGGGGALLCLPCGWVIVLRTIAILVLPGLEG